jgi:hypothetical protein
MMGRVNPTSEASFRAVPSSRRFYRKKVGAAKTLEDFSAKLGDETDLDPLKAVW